MDIWSKEEIDFIKSYHPKIPNEKVDSRFELFGGVPRLIFSNDRIELKLAEKLKSCSLIDITNSTINMTSTPETFSYWLVHWRPIDPAHEIKAPVIASQYIARKLVVMLYEKEKKEFLKYLEFCQTESYEYGSLRGRLFEYYAHYVLTNNKIFRKRNLKKEEKEDTLVLPQLNNKEVKEFTLKENSGSYCRPQSKIYPGIDSWIVGTGFFQITVGMHHDVSFLFCDLLRQYKLQNKAFPPLYFVVPEDSFGFFGYQKLKIIPVSSKQKKTNRAYTPEDDENIFSEVAQYVIAIPMSYEKINQNNNSEYNGDMDII